MVDVCRAFEEHEDLVSRGRASVPDQEAVVEIADFFGGLGSPTRLTILFALSGAGLCTCDLSGITGLSVSAVSHQLRILRDRRLVASRKAGKNVFYRLRDAHVADLLSVALTHFQERGSHA